MRKDQSFRRHARRLLDDAIHAARAFTRDDPGALAPYERLLHHVRTRTRLLRPSGNPSPPFGDHTRANAGLHALALHHADWLRPVETWDPPWANPWPIFTSLAHHLFALYPVPAFMTSAWFQVPTTEVFRRPDWHNHLILPEHAWYKHLGRGGSIRTAGVPLRLTRAMAHHFTHAPHHYTVRKALRWAQVRGLGGDEALARAVAGTRLGRAFENEEFWETALLFFVRHRPESAHVGPVVDSLQAQKFGTEEVFVPGQGFARRPPPRPDYSLKGRTLASVLRQVEAWHRELGQTDQSPRLAWARCAIGELRHVEGTPSRPNLRCWTVRELLSSRELFLEGQAMRHCVATYAGCCARRQTSIWSLTLESERGTRRVLTVEVDLRRRTISQARGCGNRLPRKSERAVLELWADREGLKIADCL